MEIDLPILKIFTSTWDENKLNLNLSELVQQEILDSIEKEKKKKRKKTEKKQKKNMSAESFFEQTEEIKLEFSIEEKENDFEYL